MPYFIQVSIIHDNISSQAADKEKAAGDWPMDELIHDTYLFPFSWEVSSKKLP